MENGKRIEFKRAAKIVILVIAILTITGITAVEAFSVEDCPNCPKSGLVLRSSACYISETYLHCFYGGDLWSDGDITMRSYSTPEEAKNAFEKQLQSAKARVRDSDKILSNNSIEFIYTSEKNFALYGYFLHIEKNIIIQVFMKIRSGCTSDSDKAEAKTRVQEFAKCAHGMTGWENVPVLSEPEEKYTLTLEHCLPYYESEDDPRRAGDLVATLTDKETKEPVPCIEVVFYVEKDEEDKGEKLCKVTRKKILRYYDQGSFISIPNIEDMRNLLRFSKNKFLRLRITDSKGEARINYLHSLDPELFSEELKRGENGKITGTIKVVALTQEDLENKQESLEDKKWKIECEKSVDIELSSVARITTIKSLNNDDPMVRVIPVGSETGDRIHILDTQLPYDLFCGDVILLNESDIIDVQWLTGAKMKIQPKAGVLEKDEFADVCITGTGVGWYTEISQNFDSQVLGGVLIGGSFYLTITAASIPAGVIASIPGIFIFGWNVYGDYCEPLLIQPYSTILIDFDKTATVYTVEGTGRLHNIKDYSTTDVTTGRKISVLPDGTFSQISEFDRSELSEDLSYLLESIEKDESDKHSELEISKLYVGKSVYPRGTEVDVYYDVKNIGTVDVDEYYVEYKINDFKGNEVYTFVGSTHSIASGEQQKFIAAENWKIPSDARIGPYIINCALIWGSKRDTAGSEFFVTHPANREDRTAELEISNLYTGKSEYLKGAGERVDVCYYVKNTGTVDISEYHVIYQIFDSEWKRYCWFISDMFGSIVAGKEDKWQSGVWKVPSDAKVGRYTVDAMVIWGLDRFSRETAYFFVK